MPGDRFAGAGLSAQPTRKGTHAVQQSETPSQPDEGRQGTRFHPTDADPERRDPAGARRARRARLRHDRQRQDGGVPAADPEPADGQAARHHARARAHADARTGRADPRRPQRSRRAHADHRGIGVRRRRHGTAGTRVPQRCRRDHRHAGPPARSLPHAVRKTRRARASGARRSRPHARHGLPARHQARVAPSAQHSGRRCSSARRCRRRSRR